MIGQPQPTHKLFGKYEALSGRRFQYYGFCTEWVEGGQSPWTVWLYDENKKFAHDDVRTSPDMLAELSSFGLNFKMGRELTTDLARHTAEKRIEEWDRANVAR